MEIPATRAKLLQALARADEHTREERAERIEWLARHTLPLAFAGEIAVLRILEEARLSFVSGHFVGTILLATAFVEQTLSEELEQVATSDRERGSLKAMLEAARKRLHFPADLLDRTDNLRLLRNPFTHRKATDHPHSFGTRFEEMKVHPTSILELDAKLAMDVMYEWFQRTLRRAEQELPHGT